MTPYECAECLSIRQELRGRTWSEIPAEFMNANCNILSLLSPEAYAAFLAAWLRQGVLDPDGVLVGSCSSISGISRILWPLAQTIEAQLSRSHALSRPTACWVRASQNQGLH